MQFIIFPIKQEIAQIYYYKVEMMKRFFLEWMKDPASPTHKNQIAFITELFPFRAWLEEYSPLKTIIDKCLNVKLPFFDSSFDCDIMDNKNYCCLFQCESFWQAESAVLEPLRRSSQSFFIIETNGDHYGWISSPGKDRQLS